MFKKILKIPKLVNQAIEILGFKGRQDRIMDLSLEQLYNLLIIKNTNIKD